MKHPGKICVACLAACLTLTGCGLLPEEEVYRSASEFTNYEADDYSYVTVAQGNLQTQFTVTARFIPTESADLSFGVSGVALTQLYVEPGDFVENGQLLAELDCSIYEQRIAEYEKEMNELKYQREYYEKLLDIEVRRRQLLYNESYETAYNTLYKDVTCESVNKILDIDGDLYLLEIKLNNAAEERKNRQIYASMAGTIGYLKETDETYFSKEGEKFITIIDDSLVFKAETKEHAYFTVGMKATLTIDDVNYTAVVSALEDSKTNYKNIYFEIPDTTETFAQNTRGTITIIKELHENVLYLPASVISTIDGKSAVYVLDSDGVRRVKYVTTGFKAGNKIEIVEGLSLGDAVIKK